MFGQIAEKFESIFREIRGVGAPNVRQNSSHTQFFKRVLANQGPAKHFRTTP